MSINPFFLPEENNIVFRKNAETLFSPTRADNLIHDETPLLLPVSRCSSEHHLFLRWGRETSIIPRGEAVLRNLCGAQKEISVLSLVGKEICCCLTDMQLSAAGNYRLIFSRKKVQEKALNLMLQERHEGDIIPATVTSLSPIGVFADIGCGIPALLPLRQISVSRISHPRERFSLHQQIFVVLEKIDRENARFFLSHKELLGTWQENASCFSTGETVTGTIRGIREYGIFIELTPNLTGLAEPEGTYSIGDRVSVLVKSIQPEKQKIKLRIIAPLPPAPYQPPLCYFLTEGTVRQWSYSESRGFLTTFQ